MCEILVFQALLRLPKRFRPDTAYETEIVSIANTTLAERFPRNSSDVRLRRATELGSGAQPRASARRLLRRARCGRQLGGPVLPVVSSNNSEQSFEFFPCQTERAHVRTDDVFTHIPIHLDDDRARHAGSGHDEMIASRACFDTTCEFADVWQFLPRTLLTLWRRGRWRLRKRVS